MVRVVRKDVKRFSELRKKRFNFRITTIVFSIALFVGLVSFVFASDNFKISHIDVVGAENTDVAMIEAIVNNVMSGSYAYLIPKNNFIIYPRVKIKERINEQFPQIGEVETKVGSFTNLEVKLTKREEKYVWCPMEVYEEKVRKNKTSGCFYTDDSGLIFKEAPTLSEGTFLELVSNVPPPDSGSRIGLHAIDESLFKKINSIIAEISGPSISIVRVMLQDNGDIILSTNKKWDIMIAGSTELDKIMRNLNVAFASAALKPETIDERGGLEYLDLRFGNKVFIKFRN